MTNEDERGILGGSDKSSSSASPESESKRGRISGSAHRVMSNVVFDIILHFLQSARKPDFRPRPSGIDINHHLEYLKEIFRECIQDIKEDKTGE